MVFVFLVFPTAVETMTRGKSLGKYAFGLRTVRDDAGPISFQHAFVRALIAIVEIYMFFGGPAFFAALMSSRGKRLGDFAAGTYVVRERVRLRLAAPPAMPPHLAAWAAGADMASLPTGLALAVRQFLGRLPQIDPAARASLGGRLAEQVSAYVAPPPPDGTPPEAFLAAVVAARRERDSARLAREAELRARLTAGRLALGRSGRRATSWSTCGGRATTPTGTTPSRWTSSRWPPWPGSASSTSSGSSRRPTA